MLSTSPFASSVSSSFSVAVRETTASTANENNIDSNPYAYPYFQTKSCLLYELVVKGFENDGNENNDDYSIPSEKQEDQSRYRTKLYKRIKSRCLIKPTETQWVDSCGETALHRICQIARFSPSSSSSSSTSQLFSFPNPGFNEEEKEEIFAHHLRQGEISQNELLLHSLRAILDADFSCASNTNNWGETPLHQFLTHCGIIDTTSTSCLKRKSSLLSLEVLDLLLQAHPNATSTPNYLQSLPLHEACSLSQLTRESTQTIIDLTPSSSSSSTTLASKAWDHQKQHLQVIKRLIEHQPKALFVKTNAHELPLTRAVSSPVSSVEVVQTLLSSMEEYFLKKFEHHYQDIRNYMKSKQLKKGGELEEEKDEGDELGNMVKEAMRQSVMGRKTNQRGRKKQRVVDPLSPLGVHWKRMMETVYKVTFISDSSSSSSSFAIDSGVPSLKQSSNTTKTSIMSISSMITNYLWTSHFDNDVHIDNSKLEMLHSRALHLSHQLGDVWIKSLLLLHVAYHGTSAVQQPSHYKHQTQSKLAQQQRDMTISKGENGHITNDSTLVPTTSNLLSNDALLLHAAIKLHAPLCIIKLASFLNLSCLTTQDEEHGRKTPLFLAVEEGGCKLRQRKQQWQEQKEGREHQSSRKKLKTQRNDENQNHAEDDRSHYYESSLIQFLTSLSPTSAGIADSMGRLPLHIAIESGYTVGAWRRDCGSKNLNDDGTFTQIRRDKATNGEDRVLRDIFDAKPRAVSIRDPVTRLYPFMMAAAASSPLSMIDGQCSADDMLEEDENETCIVVETIFELLRADPSVLRNAPFA